MDKFQDFLISLGDKVITGYTGDGAEQCTNYDQEIETFSTPDLTPAGVLGWLKRQK